MVAEFLERVRLLFEGDPAVRRVADDPVLTAELMLLLRMMLADGEASDAEMEAFKRICREAFGIDEAALKEVVSYLQDFGYEITTQRAVDEFSRLDAERRLQLGRHMVEIARSDAKLPAQELDFLKRIVKVLGIDPKALADRA